MRRTVKGDVAWYLSGRKRPIAYSTKAASDLIVALAEDGATVQDVHARITYDREARTVLETYIEKGLGDSIANALFK